MPNLTSLLAQVCFNLGPKHGNGKTDKVSDRKNFVDWYNLDRVVYFFSKWLNSLRYLYNTLNPWPAKIRNLLKFSFSRKMYQNFGQIHGTHISDGHPEQSAHAWWKICVLWQKDPICDCFRSIITCLGQIKYQRLFLTCASVSEQSSNISTMVRSVRHARETSTHGP